MRFLSSTEGGELEVSKWGTGDSYLELGGRGSGLRRNLRRAHLSNLRSQMGHHLWDAIGDGCLVLCLQWRTTGKEDRPAAAWALFMGYTIQFEWYVRCEVLE